MLRLAVVLTALMFVPAATVAAQERTVTVPGTLVFEHGPSSERSGNCSAVVFAQWDDDPKLDVISARVLYVDLNGERSKVAKPPYDDTYDWVRVYTAPAGTHRIEVATSWADGPHPDDCSGMNARHSTELFPDHSIEVELTVDDSAKCAAAQRKVTEAGRETLAARVVESRAITSKQQRKATKALRKAEKAERKARRKAARVCAS